MRRTVPTLALAATLAALAAPSAADEPVPVRPVLPRVKQPVKKGAPVPTVSAATDPDTLKKANLPPDDAKALLDYIRARTLSDAEHTKIGDVIARFGDDEFDVREKALETAVLFGPAAIGPLKAATANPDPEVAYRAKLALRLVEKVPHTQVVSAAARALAKLRHKDAAGALLAYLPLAEDEVSEVIRGALVALALTGADEPEPALVAALADTSAARRAAAYVALVDGTARAPEAAKAARARVSAAAAKDADPEARFQGLWALLAATRDRAHVADLIAAAPKLPRGRIWQLEGLLVRAAGERKPKASFGKSEEALTKARDAWADWWQKNGAGVELAKIDFATLGGGFTDIVEYDVRAYGQTRVVALGPDLKEKVKFGGPGQNQVYNPADARRLPNGNYLVCEFGYSRITERDTNGDIKKTTVVNQPISAEVLPDGGTLVIGQRSVVQFDKDMKPQWTFNWQQSVIFGGARLPNGDVVFVTNMQGQPNCHRIGVKREEKDGKVTWEAKEAGKALSVGQMQQYCRLDATENSVLVCEFNRVAEYDLKTGKELWKHTGTNPMSCQRLPNGNTLIAFHGQGSGGKLVEVDAANEVLWEYEAKDGLRVAKGYRR